MAKKRVMVLGATGSIGSGALDIMRSFPELFELVAVSAHTDISGLSSVIREFRPRGAALSGAGERGTSPVLPEGTCFYQGPGSVVELIREIDADIVVNGISGAAGLLPSWYSITTGKDLALANKETIVTAGPIISREAEKRKRKILPVDSEHSALFHLLENRSSQDVEELILTASGGPFRDKQLSELGQITWKEAVAHPTWKMGRKISIDSATMANKGLEVIEAVRLFSMLPERIKVLIHPQSIVHSLIRTRDGSLYAQLSKPDMRLPIQNALTWPEMEPCTFASLDLAGHTLEFQSPRPGQFPLLELAYEAAAASASYPIAFNAADEVAVEVFIEEGLSYPEIPELVEATLQADWTGEPDTMEEVLDMDRKARDLCRSLIHKRSKR